MLPTKKDLDNALKILGSKYLKEPWKSKWTPSCPVMGYCYAVCVLLLYTNRDTLSPQRVVMPDGSPHYYLTHKVTGEIVDMTVEQWETTPKYSEGKYSRALWVNSFPRATCELADILGLELTLRYAC